MTFAKKAKQLAESHIIMALYIFLSYNPKSIEISEQWQHVLIGNLAKRLDITSCIYAIGYL